ncbi:MAG: hypothetical protein U0610_03360 [bacterium]
MRATSAIAALALVVTSAPRLAFAAPLDYLVIEPNSGSSSGGHVALRAGDSTYHFQHHEDGTIRLHRTDSASFELTYRALENRAIEALGIDLDADEARRVRDRFELRLLAETHVFEHEASLAEDERLLAWLAGEASSGASQPEARATLVEELPGLPAAGYFEDRAPATPSERESPLAELRRAIEARFGADAIAERQQALAAAIEALRPAPRGGAADWVAPGRVRAWEPGFAQRHRTLATAWLALELLRSPRALAPDALVEPGGVSSPLASEERARLQEWSRELVRTLPLLFSSRREDWGEPLLIGLARLLAIDASLASGRLRVLDAFADGAPIVPASVTRRASAVLARVSEERRQDLAEARRRFVANERLDEADLSRLERAASLAYELERAAAEGVPVRRLPEVTLPTRAAWPPAVPMPRLGADERARGLAETSHARGELRAAIERVYRYDLFDRNCVTELFRTLDGPGADGPTRIDGLVDADAVGGFLPAVSAQRVAAAYPIASRARLPSFREVQLARQGAGSTSATSPTAAWRELRESNVFSARSYASGRFDEPFVFFTSERVAARPVLGAINLAVGVSAIAAGILAAPFDGGAVLHGGVDGALFSLPELVFANVRKGSYAILPQDWEDWPG